LSDIIEKRKTIDEEKAIEWTIQILQALAKLREKNIIHRNINPKYS